MPLMKGLARPMASTSRSRGLWGMAPGESTKDYVQGSYAYDPTPGEDTAEIASSFDASGSHPASLTLLGGSRGASFRIAKFNGVIGQPINAVVVMINVPAGQKTTIGTEPLSDANHQSKYTVQLADTYYTAQVPSKVIAPTPPLEPSPGYKHIDQQAPSASILDSLTTLMTNKTVGPIPDGVWVGIVVVAAVGTAILLVKK